MAERRITVLLCGSRRVVKLDASIGRGDRRPRLDSRREAPVDGPPDWGTEWASAVGRAAAGLMSEKSGSNPVGVVLPSVFLLARTATCPRSAARRRGAVAAFAATAALPAASGETVAMHAVTGGDAGWLDLTVLVARVPVVERLLRELDRAGCGAAAALPRPLAVHAALAAEVTAADEPQLVLDCDGTSAVLWRLHRGRTLVRAFRLPAGFPDGDITVRLAVLAREVRRTLVHVARQGAEAAPAKLWLSGDPADDAALAEGLGVLLGLPVAVLPAPDTGLSAAEHGAVQLACAWRHGRDGDLMPSARRTAEKNAMARRAAAFAAAGVAIALLGSTGIFLSRTRATEAEVRALQIRLEPVRAAAERRDALHARVTALEREAAEFERLQAERIAWLTRLSDLENRFSRAGDARLERLELQPGPEPGADGAPVRLRLSGRVRGGPGEARAQARGLVAALAAAPWVATLESPQLVDDADGVRFDLLLALRPEAPAPRAPAGLVAPARPPF